MLCASAHEGEQHLVLSLKIQTLVLTFDIPKVSVEDVKNINLLISMGLLL